MLVCSSDSDHLRSTNPCQSENMGSLFHDSWSTTPSTTMHNNVQRTQLGSHTLRSSSSASIETGLQAPPTKMGWDQESQRHPCRIHGQCCNALNCGHSTCLKLCVDSKWVTIPLKIFPKNLRWNRFKSASSHRLNGGLMRLMPGRL